jgi:hypothetical protein
MPAAPNALRVVSSLRLGERGIARCGDGLLAAENALFDARDIVLRMTDVSTVREAGYMTTAGEALGRLAMAGVTPEFAEDAARAIPPGVAASFARGETARALAGQLGAHELFDGAVYSAAAQRYEGVWLDLRALSSALSLPSAPVVLQALHLAAALSEVPPTTTVLLSTSATRRPSERGHFRMILNGTRWLLDALRQLAPNPRPPDVHSTNDERMRDVLLARVRERATAETPPRLQRRFEDLQNAIAGKTERTGPLADPELEAIDRLLMAGESRGVDAQLDRLEHLRGKSPGTRYLRARLALVRGDEHPGSVAQRLSQLVEEHPWFHEASLQAARAWLAAGEISRARFYARRIVEDTTAGDGERLVGLEILESTGPTSESHAPPPVVVGPPEVIVPPRHAMQIVRVAPLYPTLGNAPLPEVLPPLPLEAPTPTFALPQAAVTPPQRAIRYNGELVESLALPLGATESILGLNELPTTSIQARVAMTRLARDLARDYRLWYAKTLRCNVMAVEAMQQHLATRYSNAPISDPVVAWELRRHGALLSEIIARALDGDWTDIAPSEPGYWAMLVPPGTRTWPIGRVYRFVSLGNSERDLVSYYLDLEARMRSAQER